jgi:hypothetical protein
MAKAPEPVKPPKAKAPKVLTLRYSGARDVVVEIDGARHWFRVKRNDGRRTKNTHLVDSDTWDKLQKIPEVAAMIAAGEVSAC